MKSLVGRHVTYWGAKHETGLRAGYVRRVTKMYVTVQALGGEKALDLDATASARYRGKKRRVPIDSLREVRWHGKMHPPSEFIAAGGGPAKSCSSAQAPTRSPQRRRPESRDVA